MFHWWETVHLQSCSYEHWLWEPQLFQRGDCSFLSSLSGIKFNLCSLVVFSGSNKNAQSGVSYRSLESTNCFDVGDCSFSSVFRETLGVGTSAVSEVGGSSVSLVGEVNGARPILRIWPVT